MNVLRRKKKVLIGVGATAFFVVAVMFNVNTSLTTNSNYGLDLAFHQVDVLAQSEKGCISKAGKNDGDCTTDGKVYFCENSWWIHDCVKGEYP